MSTPSPVVSGALPLRAYLLFQTGFWSLALLLRLLGSIAYGYRSWPMLLLEVATHLLALGGSHLVWRWVERRGAVAAGLRFSVAQGLVGSVLVAVAVGFATAEPYVRVYPEDVAQFGRDVVISTWLLFQIGMLVIWFGFILAFAYYDRARRSEMDRLEALAVMRENQWQALKAQVHPHFLFNSFNSLRALLDQDTELARQAITNLAAILRYSLTDAQQRLVPLGQELRIVAMYLDLEKLRLDQRLQVQARVPAEPTNAQIPPLLLQTLVENAVKFGPAARKQGGVVSYEVSVAGQRLHVVVGNPGSLGQHSDSTGTGLANLRARLRLLYGDAASFSLRDEGDRVVAEVTMPAHGAPLA